MPEVAQPGDVFEAVVHPDPYRRFAPRARLKDAVS
jgi:hypothetical protein